MQAIIFDTETDSEAPQRVIEAAWIDAGTSPIELLNNYPPNPTEFCKRYNPERPIGAPAMAVHHILDAEVADCPSYQTFKLPESVQYIIGHNIDFDWEIAGRPNVKLICTLALSRRLWPQFESHKQTTLMYYLLPQEMAQHVVKHAHSALADVKMCKLLLQCILEKLKSTGHLAETWERLWVFSEAARIPSSMPFGKHKGVAIKDLPADYIRWCLNQTDMDPYVLKGIEKYSKF